MLNACRASRPAAASRMQRFWPMLRVVSHLRKRRSAGELRRPNPFGERLALTLGRARQASSRPGFQLARRWPAGVQPSTPGLPRARQVRAVLTYWHTLGKPFCPDLKYIAAQAATGRTCRRGERKGEGGHAPEAFHHPRRIKQQEGWNGKRQVDQCATGQPDNFPWDHLPRCRRLTDKSAPSNTSITEISAPAPVCLVRMKAFRRFSVEAW